MNRLLDAVFGPDPGVGLFSGFILVNLAVGATILAVAGLRIPARRLFGPATAYKLWIAPLIVALLGALFVFVPADSDTGSVAAALRAPTRAMWRPSGRSALWRWRRCSWRPRSASWPRCGPGAAGRRWSA